METYKNSYKIEEDYILWELHEIRQVLHKEFKEKTIEEINKAALKKAEEWKKEITGN